MLFFIMALIFALSDDGVKMEGGGILLCSLNAHAHGRSSFELFIDAVLISLLAINKLTYSGFLL